MINVINRKISHVINQNTLIITRFAASQSEKMALLLLLFALAAFDDHLIISKLKYGHYVVSNYRK